MAIKYTQEGRPLRVHTSLGADALLLEAIHGQEGLSQLYDFQLDLLADPLMPVPFEKLLAQPGVVEIHQADGTIRHVHGIFKSLRQGRRDAVFVHYQAALAPRFWLWTKNVQSRVFQEMTTPDILQVALGGLAPHLQFKLQGTYHPRDHCVQYRESDFAFVSRLMEEEGIFYFFEHSANEHRLVVTDSVQACVDIAEPKAVRFEEGEGGPREETLITSWAKTQHICTENFSLWDHCFQVPEHTLEATASLPAEVRVGTGTHHLTHGGNLESYDYPGGYARAFDGVDAGGGERSQELPRLFSEGPRVVQLRMEQEASQTIRIEGTGTCGRFAPGFAFHFLGLAEAAGEYLVSRVEHRASIRGGFRSGEAVQFEYANTFQCLPRALPYRPPLTTPRPVVLGVQTATVIGPAGEQIFTDKYGRVKVRFHWDRPGRQPRSFSGNPPNGWPTRGVAPSGKDGACWIRVGQAWAGKGFGAVHIPRIGQEVIVGFLEGNPDDPIILGSVYNAQNMPPYPLPEHKHHSGIVTQSQFGDQPNASEIRFEDTLGQEHMVIHSERDLHHNAENDHRVNVGNDHQMYVGNNHAVNVGSDQNVQVGRHLFINVGGPAGGGGSSGSGGSAATEPVGSGSGGANAWDYIFSPSEPWTDGKTTVKTPNYLTYVKGLNDTMVGGANTIVVFGLDAKMVIGGMVVVAMPFQVNIHAGWRLEMNKSKRLTLGSITDTRVVNGQIVEVATQAITHTSPLRITQTVGANVIQIGPGNITITGGGNIITLSAGGITLTAGASTITMTNASIILAVGGSTVTLSANSLALAGAAINIV